MDLGMLDHLFAVILVVVLPVLGVRHHRRFFLRLKAGHDSVRLRYYRSTMLEEWGLVAALLVIWLSAGRSLPTLGLGLEANARMWIGLGAMFVVVFLAFAQTVVTLRSVDRMESLRNQVAPLLGLVPHDDRELRTWSALSVTAGICEELLYRGFLMAYLTSAFGLWPAVILSSLAFGFAHTYQGPVGIAKAAAAGLAMAGLFVLTGSLWVPMILHAIVDLNSGYLARRAVDSWPATVT